MMASRNGGSRSARVMATTVKEALARLMALGVDGVAAQQRWKGAGDKLFGVKLGAIRKVAAKIKTDHALALGLWKTENVDARCLAILMLETKKLSQVELDRMVRDGDTAQVADWLNSYVVKNHPDKEALRVKWMKDKE